MSREIGVNGQLDDQKTWCLHCLFLAAYT